MLHSKLEKLYNGTHRHLAQKTIKSNTTLSENGAKKFISTGNDFVDQFSKCGGYLAQRSFAEIANDCEILWSQHPLNCVKFIIYLRTITRKTAIADSKTKNVQRGTGLRHEAIMRMMWLQINHPDVFWQNLPLFVSVGSWDDVFTMLKYDLMYQDSTEIEKNLDWDSFGQFILDGLINDSTRELVKKYLPTIRNEKSRSTVEAQANNVVGKWFAKNFLDDMGLNSSTLFSYYRKFKSSGTAHVWQRQISQGRFSDIDFGSIAGRALKLLTDSKFLENNGLEEKFTEWINSQEDAKFTGYPNEVFKNVANVSKEYQKNIINKQFNSLVNTAKDGLNENTSYIVVRDTSNSMCNEATGTKQSCYDVSKAIGLFFSHLLNKGIFAKTWIEFNSDALLHSWVGDTPYEQWVNDKTRFYGSTNFMSAIELLANMKEDGHHESEFPTGIICISDMEFDNNSLDEITITQVYPLLRDVGFSEEYISNFKIVLWNLQRYDAGDKFETDDAKTKNVFYFSGYDPSIIAFLIGGKLKSKHEPKNAEELFEAAMNQEILNMVKI